MKFQLQYNAASFYSLLISLFFILMLYIKASYTAIPLFVALGGIILYASNRSYRFLGKDEKWLISIFLFYAAIFLVSLIVNGGKLRELDAPSKALLLLPAFIVSSRLKLNQKWILYSILCSAILAGIFITYRFSILKIYYLKLFPGHMYIQAGGFLVSLGLFSLAIAFHFYRQKLIFSVWISLIASSLAIWGALINQARGPWIALPFIILIIFIFNRKLISKWIILFLTISMIIFGSLAGNFVKKRWDQAVNETEKYFVYNQSQTSVGARLDMWKSSLLGIWEAPILGRGIENIKVLREQHLEKGIISPYAAKFTNAHNQYLHDTTARGLLALFALLGIFLIPLKLFLQRLNQNSDTQLWGMLGIIHILATMSYCLTQSFLSHNSGMMFYCFIVILFLGLQKSSLNQPLVETK